MAEVPDVETMTVGVTALLKQPMNSLTAKQLSLVVASLTGVAMAMVKQGMGDQSLAVATRSMAYVNELVRRAEDLDPLPERDGGSAWIRT